MNDVDECIRHKISWAQLPAQVKQLLGNSQKEYQRYIFEFSIRNQLRYRGNLVRTIRKDERRYYEALVQNSIRSLMLFPYHLADMVVKGLRITPFSYYKEVVGLIMEMEKSYDTLPNFTAADCLRLLGIGRNEYIELMNRARGRGRVRRTSGRRLLPSLPCQPPLQPWWRLELGYVLEDDVKYLNDEERSLIDILIDEGSQTLGILDHATVQSLYKKGLVYIDVPITGVDRVRVPPLQGFVMNRVMGDYFETLLYKIFVSIDENTTVSELSSVLQVDVDLVKQAVSLYCRLGFAQKMDIPTINNIHPSWLNLTPVRIARPVTPLTFDHTSQSSSLEMEPVLTNLPETPLKEERPIFPGVYKDSSTDDRRGPRFAFLFDSTLTAYLMMGNLSPDLKNHAVTMFEVGKLCDESINSFLDELDKIAWQDIEGEAKRYWTHALVLRSALRALAPLRPMDLVRCESLQSLDTATAARLLNNKYKLLVSMAPLSREVRPPTGAPITPPFLGPCPRETNSLWFKLYIYHITGYGPPTLILTKGAVLKHLPRLFLGFSRLLVSSWQHEAVVLATCNFLAINATLKYSPVMVQAYGVRDAATTILVPFPSSDDDKDDNGTSWWQHSALKRLSSSLDLEHTCGYITMVDIGVPDWGIETLPTEVFLGKAPVSTMRRKSRLAKVPSSQMSFDESIIDNQNVFDKAKDQTNTQDQSKTSSTEDVKINEDKLRREISEKLNLGDSAAEGSRLQSPNESHFAVTPTAQSKTHSPANGFTSVDCSNILCQELDQLDKQNVECDNFHSCKINDKRKAADIEKENLDFNKTDVGKILRLEAIDNLMSPVDENISMFSQLNKELEAAEKKSTKPVASSSGEQQEEISGLDERLQRKDAKAEKWTLLECHFGIPLFDEDANQKICKSIVTKLSQRQSLEKLTESNKALSVDLLTFISQCQYFPGEDMGIVKRGHLVPLPKKNLAFENGRISLWSDKCARQLEMRQILRKINEIEVNKPCKYHNNHWFMSVQHASL